MKHKIFLPFLTAVLVILVSSGGVNAQPIVAESDTQNLVSAVDTAAQVGTTFTYQGHLSDGGSSANGSYDFRFKLFDAASDGVQMGNTLTKNAVSVVDGFFMVNLDFGNVFDGTALFLDIGVRSAGSSTYTTLSPRQALTAAPSANYSRSVPWSGIIGIPSGLNDGDDDTTYQAGAGLTLNAGQFSVDFAGSGTATTVSHSDHNHMNQTWSNDNAILKFGSTTGFSSTGLNGSAIGGSTMDSASYGGYFQNQSHLIGDVYHPGGPALYARSSGNQYPDIVLGGTNDLENGVSISDDGTISSEPTLSGSDIILFANDRLWIHLDEAGVNNSDFVIKNGANVNVFSVNESGAVTTSGPLNCPDPCIIQTSTADFAEMLPAARELEPGDVLIIGTDGLLSLSTQPYQANVVGVFSTQPGYLGGGEFMGQDGYVPLAVVGVAPVKASAENGPIQPGDLLTSSGMPGHAMRAGENPPTGTVIGKALQALENGTGVIQMLVVLQ